MQGASDAAANQAAPSLTVVVPSGDGRAALTPLRRGLGEALRGIDVEVLHVEGSCAVRDRLRQARGSYVVVVDGSLAPEPGLVARLLRAAQEEHADLVVASRYSRGGDTSSLGSPWRRWVSRTGSLLAGACFPRRVGRVCRDPLSGSFCLRRDAVDPDRLHARPAGLLLEVLARHDLSVVEIPLTLGPRQGAQTRASWRAGVAFLRQLLALRLGRMSRFAVVGGLGTLVNLAVMWLCLRVPGFNYVAAAVVATEVSILHNFLLQERFVFQDMRGGRHGYAMRMGHFFAFNNIEALVRMPLLVLLVSGLGLYSVLAQGLTLGVAFVARFFWTSQVIYRPKRSRAALTGEQAAEADPLPGPE